MPNPNNTRPHSDLGRALFEICQSQNLRHLAIIEAARTDPKVDALHKIFLLAADTSEDEPRHVLNDVISRIEKLAKTGLGL